MHVPPAIIEKSAHLLNEVQSKGKDGYAQALVMDTAAKTRLKTRASG